LQMKTVSYPMNNEMLLVFVHLNEFSSRRVACCSLATGQFFANVVGSRISLELQCTLSRSVLTAKCYYSGLSILIHIYHQPVSDRAAKMKNVIYTICVLTVRSQPKNQMIPWL
jgi:hypothetical protein